MKGAKGTLVIESGSCKGKEFKGNGFNVLPLVTNCIIIVEIAVIMSSMALFVILKNFVCNSAIRL